MFILYYLVFTLLCFRLASSSGLGLRDSSSSINTETLHLLQAFGEGAHTEYDSKNKGEALLHVKLHKMRSETSTPVSTSSRELARKSFSSEHVLPSSINTLDLFPEKILKDVVVEEEKGGGSIVRPRQTREFISSLINSKIAGWLVGGTTYDSPRAQETHRSEVYTLIGSCYGLLSCKAETDEEAVKLMEKRLAYFWLDPNYERQHLEAIQKSLMTDSSGVSARNFFKTTYDVGVKAVKQMKLPHLLKSLYGWEYIREAVNARAHALLCKRSLRHPFNHYFKQTCTFCSLKLYKLRRDAGSLKKAKGLRVIAEWHSFVEPSLHYTAWLQVLAKNPDAFIWNPKLSSGYFISRVRPAFNNYD